MALIMCPECGGKVSEFAEACPHCGCPMAQIKDILTQQESEQEREEAKRLCALAEWAVAEIERQERSGIYDPKTLEDLSDKEPWECREYVSEPGQKEITKPEKDRKLESSELMEAVGDLESEKWDQLYDSLEALSIDYSAEEDLLPDDGDPWNVEWSWEEEFLYPFCSELDDPVRMYLKEIGKVALLTPEEEISLAQAMSAGNEAKDRLTEFRRRQEDGEDVDSFEESTLKKQCQSGEAARQKLVEANLRLVVHIAKDYVGQGMLFLDLIQDGNLGLIEAVDMFDYTKGYRLFYYATWWIRQAITRDIANQAAAFSFSAFMSETIMKVNRISRQLLQELGHAPSPNEIAAEMNMPVDKVWEIMKIAQEPVSLDALDAVSDVPELRLKYEKRNCCDFHDATDPVPSTWETWEWEDDGSSAIPMEDLWLGYDHLKDLADGDEYARLLESSLGTALEEQQISDVEDAAYSHLLREQILDVLSTLTPREERVLRLRFGIDDGRTRTLEEVGKEFNFTRERIRQIEARALRKLRHPSRSKRLKDFL